MTDNAGTLDPRWRQRIRESGMDTFVRQEMIRLGFWKPGATLNLSESEREYLVAELEKSYKRLSDLKAELAAVNRDMAELGDVKELLKIARAKRIERVAKEREERKLRKAEDKRIRQEADRERRRVTPPYLGAGVSAKLTFDGGDAEKLLALNLPSITTVSGLSRYLDTDESRIAWLAYHREAVRCEHYTRFVIPKRSGGERVIAAPKPELKSCQDWINREILTRVPLEDNATAFRPGASILDNARRHSGKGVVIRLDFKDFFPTFTFPRVRGLFEGMGYNPGIASVLALLCTESPRVHAILQEQSWFVATGPRRLPQGAPTSPALSNLLCRRLDRRIAGLVNSIDAEWVYSRYADDMVFSHPDKDSDIGGLLEAVRRIVADEGLVLNHKKTAVMRAPHRQIVTGLVVNEVPRIPRQTLRKFRALLHRCDTHGFETVSSELGLDALAHVRGYLSFVQMVMPSAAARIRARYDLFA